MANLTSWWFSSVYSNAPLTSSECTRQIGGNAPLTSSGCDRQVGNQIRAAFSPELASWWSCGMTIDEDSNGTGWSRQWWSNGLPVTHTRRSGNGSSCSSRQLMMMAVRTPVDEYFWAALSRLLIRSAACVVIELVCLRRCWSAQMQKMCFPWHDEVRKTVRGLGIGWIGHDGSGHRQWGLLGMIWNPDRLTWESLKFSGSCDTGELGRPPAIVLLSESGQTQWDEYRSPNPVQTGTGELGRPPATVHGCTARGTVATAYLWLRPGLRERTVCWFETGRRLVFVGKAEGLKGTVYQRMPM